MKTMHPICFVVLALLFKTVSAQDGSIDQSSVVDVENLDSTHRELLRKSLSRRQCIGREMVEFNQHFDALEFRDMVFADAGVSAEQLTQARKDSERGEFSQSPELMAVMDAIEKHAGVLKQAEQIFLACEDEVAGGMSAVGAGATVGKIFARALEGESAMDENIPDQGATAEQMPTVAPSKSVAPSAAPSGSSAPSKSIAPSAAPSESSAPSISKNPTSAPSEGPAQFPVFTPWPTFDYDFPTWSPTDQGTDSVFLGIHMEASFFLECNQAWFTTGATRSCLGLTSGLGGDVSIIVMATVTPDIVRYPCSNLIGIDAGLGVAAGAACGYFTNLFGGGDVPVFQLTLGVGAGLSVDISACNHIWFRNNF